MRVYEKPHPHSGAVFYKYKTAVVCVVLSEANLFWEENQHNKHYARNTFFLVGVSEGRRVRSGNQPLLTLGMGEVALCWTTSRILRGNLSLYTHNMLNNTRNTT